MGGMCPCCASDDAVTDVHCKPGGERGRVGNARGGYLSPTHDWGQGQRLGCDSSSGNSPTSTSQQQLEEDEALARAYAAQPEKSSFAPSVSTPPPQNGLRGAAAEAAERRAAGVQGGMSSETREQLAERRRKDALVGKIQTYYTMAGEAEPFGLRAASIDALKKHLARGQAMAKRTGLG